MSSIKIIVTGNAHAHKYAYGRGLHLVSEEIANALTKLGVAEVVEEVRTAEKVETTEKANKPTVKKKNKKK